jgi:hypothetical protein
MTRGSLLGLTLVLATACTERLAPPLSVRRERHGDETRLTLLAAPGARINARLLPALERSGGGVLRFHGTPLTADSSYFTEPPTLVVEGDPSGVIRASVCPEGEAVCRRVELRMM